MTMGLSFGGLGRLGVVGGSGGGGGSSAIFPVGMKLIVVGDSIINATNMRGWREWFNFFLFGHFETPAWSNQGVGGGCLTVEGATENGDAADYIGNREDWWLSAVDSNTAVLFAIGTNDMTRTTATLQKMKDAIDAHIADVLALGGKVILAKVLQSQANQAVGATVTKWTDFNAHLDTKHDPSNGVVTIGTTALASWDWSTMTYDNLHPDGDGACNVGRWHAEDMATYLGSGSALGDWTPNIETQGDFTGSGGTASTGTSGTVPDNFTAIFSSNGQSGGSTVGTTAACSVITHDVPGVGSVSALQVVINGTLSGVGQLAVQNIVSWAAQTPTRTEMSSLVEAAAYVKCTITSGTLTGLGGTLGTIGQFMNKTAISDSLSQSFEGVARQKPVVGLANANTNTFEQAFTFPAGAANMTIILALLKVRKVDGTAYRAPFYQGKAMPTGVTNPIGDRPRFSGTPTNGVAATIQVGAVSGGGYPSDTSFSRTVTVRLASDDSVLQTYTPGTTPMTFTPTSGTTIYIRDVFVNSLGSVTQESVDYVIA